MSSVTEEIKPTTNKTETKTESEIENKNSTNDRDENEKEDEKENDDYVPEAGVDDDEDIAEKQSKPTKQTQIDALERIKQRKLVGQLQAIVDKAGFFSKLLADKLKANNAAIVAAQNNNNNNSSTTTTSTNDSSSSDSNKKRKLENGETSTQSHTNGTNGTNGTTPTTNGAKTNGHTAHVPLVTQPKTVSGGTLKGYQMEGIRWLDGLYQNGLNGILADEMGLGKTIQCLAFLAHLLEQGVTGPFLVVAPLSTLTNWMNEIKKWMPTVGSLMYHGTKESRKEIQENFFPGKKRKNAEWSGIPIIVTSYEMVIRDKAFLSKWGWKFLIVDEGHRLKNLNCRLIQELKRLSSTNRLLLTGTPLQNNLSELWSLLNFLLPEIFDDLAAFESWFDFNVEGEASASKILEKEEQSQLVSKLHEILRPFLLRRLKSQVELQLPKKFEKVIKTKLSPLQQKYYKAGAERKLGTILSEKSFQQIKNKGGSLQNLAMQLRKVCNHPYLFEWPVDKNGVEREDEDIVNCSGKMQILDRILKKLHGQHKVLIFSQMTKMLDILEVYMGLRKYKFLRIDGTTIESERQAQISTFYKDPEVFVFLLSTRAGGLGINLVPADSVIFFDSDWNPQMDLQAQDRAHRIGQTKDVHIWRLVTADSIESRMVEKANAKLRLEALAIQKGNFSGYGSKSAFTSIYDLKELLQESSISMAGAIEDVTNEHLFEDWQEVKRQ